MARQQVVVADMELQVAGQEDEEETGCCRRCESSLAAALKSASSTYLNRKGGNINAGCFEESVTGLDYRYRGIAPS